MQSCDRLLTNATFVDKQGQPVSEGAIAIVNDKITWAGPERALPAELRINAKIIEDCSAQVITPGLIDCHTHLVYAGSRADEFKQRLDGVSYADIAKRGGGIVSTVEQTRKASEDELLDQSLPRLLAMKAEGVLTVEIKSGYGLDLETELKMLRVSRKLGSMTGVRVKTTFLGAHATPKEYAGHSQKYIDFVCNEVLPVVAEEQLADAVDVFCETIGFSLAQTEQVFQSAIALKLPIKCHAEQLSNLGASMRAAESGALSTDHLEYTDEKAVEAMKQAGTIAVILPGAFYYLRETKLPPIEHFRKAGVGMAIATDCNPGSSPTTSLLLMMNMACQLFSMTVPEVLSAVTYQGSMALGMSDEVGSIEAGMHADLLRWAITDSAELCYRFGYPIPHDTMMSGQWTDK
jgi:imidazolonepropionase